MTATEERGVDVQTSLTAGPDTHVVESSASAPAATGGGALGEFVRRLGPPAITLSAVIAGWYGITYLVLSLIHI